jgi:multiple sugar transport system substrate-binding protein
MKDQVNKSMSRRQMLKMLGVGSAGLMLAACAPEATPAQPAEGQTTPGEAGGDYEQGTIRILQCCHTAEALVLLENFSSEFEQTYPGVTVQLEQVPAGQNYFEKLQTLIASNTTPDVFDMWEGYVSQYAVNGVLKDLTPYVEADPEWNMSDFQPAAVEATSHEGKLYAIVRNFYPGPSMFFYNVDIFDNAGVSYPTIDWTWDDMREAARALTTGEGMSKQYGLAYETWFVPWLYWTWSNGGDTFSDDETRSTITDPAWYEAIQYWADLALVDEIAVPSTELSTMQGASNGFATGLVGMYLGYNWNIADMRAARDQGLNWASVLPPKSNKGERVFYMHLECWANSRTSQYPRTAWNYIRDYTEKAVPEFTQYYPGIPLHKDRIDELFLTPEHLEYGWGDIPQVVSDPKNIRVPGSGAKWDKISGLIQSELDLVFIGEKTAQQAAETAAPLVDEELSR